MHQKDLWRLIAVPAVTALGVAATTANAQYTTDFEDINASASGVLLTGQDGYYLPSGADFFAYTYAGNSLGVPANPEGADQFVAGVGPGSPTFARAQRDISWGTGVWEVSYDVCAFYQGSPPAANNVGSFSVQPYPGSASYIHLFSWVDINTADAWQAFYLGYNADGSAHTQPGQSPGPEWTDLELDQWYRFGTTIDFDQNRITEVSIHGITVSVDATFQPTDWYLEGGSNGGSPLPTGFRMFAGGGVAGIGVAWDNMSIEQGGAELSLDLSGSCPGQMTASVSGATPGGNVAFIYATGSGNVSIPPGNPCAGTQLGLNATATLLGTDRADANGNASISGNAPASACGRVLLQALDVSSCGTSNVITVQ